MKEIDNVVTIDVDNTCDMARVYHSSGEGMTGNYWDFHNGCHGMYDLPEFKTYNQLAQILAKKYKCTILTNNNYRYEY